MSERQRHQQQLEQLGLKQEQIRLQYEEEVQRLVQELEGRSKPGDSGDSGELKEQFERELAEK